MKQRTDLLLKVLNVISWIIFVGVSIDAGGVLSNTVYAICVNPSLTSHFWNFIDLSNLYELNQVAFRVLTTIMSLVTLLKATLFFFILKIFHDKKLDLSNPFTQKFKKYINQIAYCGLAIGVLSKLGGDLVIWALSQNVSLPELEKLKIGGADVWLLMGFIILVFAIIFKKGIELQSENELTV